MRNLTFICSFELLDKLVFEHDILTYILPYLDINNNNIPPNYHKLTLLTLETLFSKEQNVGKRNYYLYFEKLQGVDMLEALQSHPNVSIYEYASKLIVKYG